MDVGCYAVSAIRQFLGEPERAYAYTGDSRGASVDTELAGILKYDDGASARVASGFDTQAVQRYRVEAANGWIEVENAFNPPTGKPLELEYRIDGRHGVETFEPVDQYRLEVDEFASSIKDGLLGRPDPAAGGSGEIDLPLRHADDCNSRPATGNRSTTRRNPGGDEQFCSSDRQRAEIDYATPQIVAIPKTVTTANSS